jgi:hypothetical protein
MKTAEFKEEGIIYSRGEEVVKYRAGDPVTKKLNLRGMKKRTKYSSSYHNYYILL